MIYVTNVRIILRCPLKQIYNVFYSRNFYAEGAMMLTDEMQVLTGVLLGLNAIDFR